MRITAASAKPINSRQPLVGPRAAQGNKPASSSLGRDSLTLSHAEPRRRASDPISSQLARQWVETILPGAFAISRSNKPFRDAVQNTLMPERKKLADAILNNKEIMDGFSRWDKLSADDKTALLSKVAKLEGQLFGFTPPPMEAQSGVPKDGTLAYFQPDGDNLGKVVLFPDAMAKGGKWMSLSTIVHEMEHARQDQLVKDYNAGKLQKGSDMETLAKAFKSADRLINWVGEDRLSYGDYSQLNNEFDSFQCGNMVAEIVSKGTIDTSTFGYIDEQFNKDGTAMMDLGKLEQQVGSRKLLKNVNDQQAALWRKEAS